MSYSPIAFFIKTTKRQKANKKPVQRRQAGFEGQNHHRHPIDPIHTGNFCAAMALTTFAFMSTGCLRSQRPDEPTQLTATQSAPKIALQMYAFTGIPTPQYDSMVKAQYASLQSFQELLKSQCDIDGAFYIPALKTIDLKPGTTRFKDPNAYGDRSSLGAPYKDFPFQYFQLELFKLIETNPTAFKRSSGPEISILMMESLEGNCGFALPPIQFKKAEGLNPSTFVISSLQNRVLIDTSPGRHGDCVNRSRILHHELAHILVQDDPAHLCPNSQGIKVPCTKDNLMASLVWVPASRRPSPGRPSGAERPDMGDGDPFGMRQIEAQGTSLTGEQCEAIQASLKTLSGL